MLPRVVKFFAKIAKIVRRAKKVQHTKKAKSANFA